MFAGDSEKELKSNSVYLMYTMTVTGEMLWRCNRFQSLPLPVFAFLSMYERIKKIKYTTPLLMTISMTERSQFLCRNGISLFLERIGNIYA